MANLSRDQKLEEMKQLFPDAFRDRMPNWGIIRRTLNNSGAEPSKNAKLLEMKRLFPKSFRKGWIDLRQIKHELGYEVVMGEDERTSAEKRQEEPRINAWAAVEREANRTIILVSGVVVGLLVNAIISPDSAARTEPFLLAIALGSAIALGLTALFITLVIFTIDSYFLQYRTFDSTDEGVREWRDNPPIAIRLTAWLFMAFRCLSEADGTLAPHVKVRRSPNDQCGRVLIHDLSEKSYRASRLAFLLGIAGSIVFLVLQATVD